MASREPRVRSTPKSDLVRRYEQEVQYHIRRRRRRRKPSRAGRVVKGVLFGVFTTFVIIPAMIAAGFLFGPRGVEGLIAAPLILLLAWAGIMYWALVGGRPPPLPALAAKTTDLAQLPSQTDEWLEAQRHHLPQEAQRRLDSIGMRLEALGVQLQGVTSEQPATADLRRLLGDELPELVRGYRKLPRAVQQQALHGGSSPERQLIEGLATIDEQIGRMQEQLAADDMQALAVHQRYLELKYKREDEDL